MILVLHRKGVAMIELIFAIVIMAIVLMSAPTLIHQSVRSGYVALQQESINTLASQLNLLLTKEWDVSNANPELPPVVLTVDSGNSDLNMVDLTTGRRVGTPMTSWRSFVSSTGGVINAVDATQFGEGVDTVGSPLDDIDDYHEKVTTLKGDGAAGGSNYIDLNITLTTTVAFGSDSPNGGDYNDTTLTFNHPFNNASSGTTNIKLVMVNLTTTNEAEELSKNITLSAFMCNIGHYKFTPPKDY